MVHGSDPRGEPDARGRAGAEHGVEDEQVCAHGGVGEGFLVVRAGVGSACEGGVLAAREGGGDVNDGDGAGFGVLRVGVRGEVGEVVDGGDVVCEGLEGGLVGCII